MGDKIFEFMEKMYSDITKRLDNIENTLVDNTGEIKTLGNQVAGLENGIKPKIETALEGYSLIYEKLGNIDKKIDELSKTVESHDVKIEVIRGAK